MYRYDYVYYTKIVTNRNLIAAHETIPSIHGSNKFVQMQLCVFKISSHGQSIIMPGSFKMFQTFFSPRMARMGLLPFFQYLWLNHGQWIIVGRIHFRERGNQMTYGKWPWTWPIYRLYRYYLPKKNGDVHWFSIGRWYSCCYHRCIACSGLLLLRYILVIFRISWMVSLQEVFPFPPLIWRVTQWHYINCSVFFGAHFGHLSPWSQKQLNIIRERYG